MVDCFLPNLFPEEPLRRRGSRRWLPGLAGWVLVLCYGHSQGDETSSKPGGRHWQRGGQARRLHSPDKVRPRLVGCWLGQENGCDISSELHRHQKARAAGGLVSCLSAILSQFVLLPSLSTPSSKGAAWARVIVASGKRGVCVCVCDELWPTQAPHSWP